MIFFIRKIKKEDLPEIANLERLCFSSPWSESALSHLLSEEGTALTAVDENQKVIGYVGVWNAPEEGQITNLAVHPLCRRMGVGKALMKKLTESAKEFGWESLSLEVRESNQAAISLYLDCGFSQVGKRKRFYRNPTEDALLMSWGRIEN